MTNPADFASDLATLIRGQRIAPRDARFVAGFGRIHNLSAAELAACSRS